MNNYVKAIIESLSEDYDIAVSSMLQEEFQKTLELYIEANYPVDIDESSLMCSIHSVFKSGHNCIACNLNVCSQNLVRFLMQYKSFHDLNLTMTNFILLLYLMVERYHEYFKIMSLPESYRLKHFRVFQDIVWWANFLKHPKSFLLLHHPAFVYEGFLYPESHYLSDVIIDGIQKKKIIDSAFVKEYYSGGENNHKLFKKLSKAEDYVVMFPNPTVLITLFVKAQKKFVTIIQENEIVRELLDSKATIKEHFEDADDDK